MLMKFENEAMIKPIPAIKDTSSSKLAMLPMLLPVFCAISLIVAAFACGTKNSVNGTIAINAGQLTLSVLSVKRAIRCMPVLIDLSIIVFPFEYAGSHPRTVIYNDYSGLFMYRTTPQAAELLQYASIRHHKTYG